MNDNYAIIGDIHGCYDNLVALLDKIGLHIKDMKPANRIDRKIIFVGDFTDRGDKPVEVLKLAMNMVDSDHALSVRGNHDDKLLRALNGNKVTINEDLEYTLREIEKEGMAFKERVKEFVSRLPFWLILDNDKLFVVHAGMKASLQGVNSRKAKAFALYGDTTGEYDKDGFPIRRDWAKEYRGRRCVVYGHQVVKEPKWINNTIDVDTGCFKTGALSLVLYPEREVMQSNPS